ncbi:XRE family transcriptional regulator [Falseniella ignava]|uniref:XRE family transcriptional regulator n=1 Tax=Falseniella ignava TaxID=137730 RepID=A0A2I1JW76_9LACT|nr:XRE family transcriptional regulator [Falseniella ignava]
MRGGTTLNIDWVRLEELLAECDLTKYQLAELIHYSPTTVYRCFNGERNPSYDFMNCIIRELALTHSEIQEIFFAN